MKYLIPLIALVLPTVALAQNGYQLLEPLPGLSSSSGVSFAQLLSVAFTVLLSVSAAAAVVMITLGGVQYMFSDAAGVKSLGRERIKNAVYGLVLVFAAWLIVYTINPNLVRFDLSRIGNVGINARPPCPNLICQTTPQRQVIPYEQVQANDRDVLAQRDAALAGNPPLGAPSSGYFSIRREGQLEKIEFFPVAEGRNPAKLCADQWNKLAQTNRSMTCTKYP